jgi:hypothetical protein
VAIVIQPEGNVLERLLDRAHSISPEGLSRHSFSQWDAAQRKTAWGRRNQRRLALVEGGAVLASAAQYDLAAIIDQRPLRVCAIGSLFSEPSHPERRHAQELLERLLDDAADSGAAMALLFSDVNQASPQPASKRFQ